ncbi:MAG: hypothetical protein M1483_06200 [Actinobacteria bacterium]|nr:hypothetical protein [Actinomycetota bacterium]MCL6105198.1 hypothetical protein [Actinomycetota bacterium]
MSTKFGSRLNRYLIERRLTRVRNSLERLKSELLVVNEQLVVFDDIEQDTRIDAVVLDAPLPKHEFDEASRSMKAMALSRDRIIAEIGHLEKKQDELFKQWSSQAKFD